MISVQTIIDRCNSRLDAEGSDRYIFERDYKPAINDAQEFIVSLFNSIFAKNKLSEESLRDLLNNKVWFTSNESRINFDETVMGHKLWTIIAVYPEITASGTATQTSITTSQYVSTIRMIDSGRSATRKTSEEIGKNKLNPFAAGNSIVTINELKDWGYINFIDYGKGFPELQIVPDCKNTLIAMTYLKYPTSILYVTDDILFPESLTSLFVDITLNIIAFKQGEGTTLYAVSDAMQNKLITLLS